MQCTWIRSSLFVAAVVAAAHANAQQLLGSWVHPSASSPALDLFVSPTGSDSNAGTSPSAPLQTLSWALNVADNQVASTVSAPRGVTINVMPGAHTVAGPLSVPAFGVSIEAYWSAPGTASPSVIGNFSNNVDGVFAVDTLVGPLTGLVGITTAQLPPSVIRGLKIDATTSGAIRNGVVFKTGINTTGATSSTRLEVTVESCEFVHTTVGIEDLNDGKFDHANVFLDNDIHTVSAGIRNQQIGAGGFSSDLIRSNRIHDMDTGLALDGSASPASSRPRVLSNFVWNCNVGISVFNTSAQIVNNTVAFMGTFGFCAIDAHSLSGSETLVIANNLLFTNSTGISPIVVSNTGPAPAAATIDSNDFGPSTSIGAVFPGPGALPAWFTAAVATNNISITTPGFVGSPPTPDLHLTLGAPSTTNAGNIGFDDPANALSSFTLGGTSLRADVNLDVDSDARISQPFGSATLRLHRGGDQFVGDGLRISFSQSATPVEANPDAFGDVMQDSAGNNVATLNLTGPANAPFSLLLCQQFSGGALMQNTIFNPSGGSWTLDLSSSNTATIASGVLSGAGTATITKSFGNATTQFLEAEVYLQLAVLRSDNTVGFSNRVRLEIDRK